jgi:Domain of unknown function (DUF4126)
MSPLFDIAQGAGLATAAGIRPFLPPLLTGALARADAGIDFEGTGFAFLESPAFLAVVLALAVAAYAAQRARPGSRGLGDPLSIAIGAVAIALGALLFAGSLAAGGLNPLAGLAAGVACALLAFVTVAGLIDRVARRLEAPAATALPAWADAAALALAAVAIVFPPAALAGIVALGYLLVAQLGGRDRKYQGLRILR